VVANINHMVNLPTQVLILSIQCESDKSDVIRSPFFVIFNMLAWFIFTNYTQEF